MLCFFLFFLNNIYIYICAMFNVLFELYLTSAVLEETPRTKSLVKTPWGGCHTRLLLLSPASARTICVAVGTSCLPGPLNGNTQRAWFWNPLKGSFRPKKSSVAFQKPRNEMIRFPCKYQETMVSTTVSTCEMDFASVHSEVGIPSLRGNAKLQPISNTQPSDPGPKRSPCLLFFPVSKTSNQEEKRAQKAWKYSPTNCPTPNPN